MIFKYIAIAAGVLLSILVTTIVAMFLQIKSLNIEKDILVANQTALVSTIEASARTINQLQSDKAHIDKLAEDFRKYQDLVSKDTSRMIDTIKRMAKDDPINNRELSPVLRVVVDRMKQHDAEPK